MRLTKWDARHLEMAHHAAAWSKDPSTKVGARIVDSRARVISEGFNGPPRGVEDNPAVDRETKLRRTIHAERNAILFAQRDLAGTTIYVTHHPCAQCAALIVQAGIARVVCNAPDPAFQVRWAEDIAEAQHIFAEAGVTLVNLEE
jgi:dCMP deaminase